MKKYYLSTLGYRVIAKKFLFRIIFFPPFKIPVELKLNVELKFFTISRISQLHGKLLFINGRHRCTTK